MMFIPTTYKYFHNGDSADRCNHSEIKKKIEKINTMEKKNIYIYLLLKKIIVYVFVCKYL